MEQEQTREKNEGLETLGSAPLFLLGGSEPEELRALFERLNAVLAGRQAVLLAGVSAGESAPPLTEALLPMTQKLLCLTMEGEWTLPAEWLAERLEKRGVSAVVCADAESAVRSALIAAGEGGVAAAFGPPAFREAVRGAFHPAFRKWVRKQKIRARDSYSPEERTALSQRVVEQILASPEFQAARTVMIYRATRGEVRLEALEAAPEARGKRLVFPLCISNMEMLALLPEGEDAWKAGYCGIAEPIPERSTLIEPEEIDMVLCPCTVFDESGSRMGMGAGFYDRYLARCTGARVASVAFEAQKTPRVPIDSWDRPMELIFTERTTYHSAHAPAQP